MKNTLKSIAMLPGLVCLACVTAATPPAGEPTAEADPFQGTWRDGYTIVIDGRTFCADAQPGEWYEGTVTIRADEEPAQLDFTIDVQSGEPNGNTSEAIFRWDGETLVVAAPSPGDPRPQDFEKKGGVILMRLERDGTSKHPAAHCLGETS